MVNPTIMPKLTYIMAIDDSAPRMLEKTKYPQIVLYYLHI